MPVRKAKGGKESHNKRGIMDARNSDDGSVPQRRRRVRQPPPPPPSCWQQTKQALFMGMVVGMGIGTVLGGGGSLIARRPPREALLAAGQGAFASSAFFASIMGIGTAVRACI